MRTRLAALGLALVVAALVATGCAPEPEPTATPPVFATEEEAFAAAEATYRAYVDALNQVDLSDPETFEAVYAWTTGDANAGERRTLSELHARGLTVDGATRTLTFDPLEFDASAEQAVLARVCSDVSEVTLIDSEGTSGVSPDRRDVYALDVTFARTPDTSTGLVISSSNAVEDPECKP